MTVRCDVCGADHEHDHVDNLAAAFALGCLAVIVFLGLCAALGMVS